MEGQGMLHLYIGSGKGKTTAAVGLSVRALGRDMKVLFAQFLKNSETGEKLILEQFPGKLCFFRPMQRHKGFIWNMTPKQLEETGEDVRSGWEYLKSEIISGKWDMVVLDEILDCVSCNLIAGDEILETIIKRPHGVEVVCTGRDASEEFRKKADYISFIEAVKHPYEKGFAGRPGIEY